MSTSASIQSLAQKIVTDINGLSSPSQLQTWQTTVGDLVSLDNGLIYMLNASEQDVYLGTPVYCSQPGGFQPAYGTDFTPAQVIGLVNDAVIPSGYPGWVMAVQGGIVTADDPLQWDGVTDTPGGLGTGLTYYLTPYPGQMSRFAIPATSIGYYNTIIGKAISPVSMQIGIIGPTPAIGTPAFSLNISTIVAAVDLNVGDVVTVEGNRADSTNTARDFGKVAGICTATTASGNLVPVQSGGPLENGAWAWPSNPNSPLFLNGTSISVTPPSSPGFSIKLGASINSYTMNVAIGPHLLLR